MRKILLFGGSFDPVHRGHIEAVRHAVAELGADEAFFIPTGVSPGKQRLLSPAADRVAMLRLALRANPDLKAQVSLFEIHRPGVSYTVDTVRHFARKYRGAQLFLLIGADQAAVFDTWKQAHVIARLCQVVCAARGSYDEADIDARFNIRFFENSKLDISSTELRSRTEAQKTYREVSDYINMHGLYLDERVRRWMSDARWEHTLGVVEAVRAIGAANGKSEKFLRRCEIAAYYHDLAKDFSREDLLSYCKKYFRTDFPKDPELQHAWVGADYCRRFYGFTDEEILRAIKNHTMPVNKPVRDMDKILYLADKTEKNRTYPERAEWHALAIKNLELAFATVFCSQCERFNGHNDASAPGYANYVRLRRKIT